MMLLQCSCIHCAYSLGGTQISIMHAEHGWIESAGYPCPSGFPGAPWLASAPQRRRPWVISSATAACRTAQAQSPESPPCSSSSARWHQAGVDHLVRQRSGARVQWCSRPPDLFEPWLAPGRVSLPLRAPPAAAAAARQAAAGAAAPVGGPHQADGLWRANAGGARVPRRPKPMILRCTCSKQRMRGCQGVHTASDGAWQTQHVWPGAAAW
jgi:hypothetical protein